MRNLKKRKEFKEVADKLENALLQVADISHNDRKEDGLASGCVCLMTIEDSGEIMSSIVGTPASVINMFCNAFDQSPEFKAIVEVSIQAVNSNGKSIPVQVIDDLSDKLAKSEDFIQPGNRTEEWMRLLSGDGSNTDFKA